jgi:hypothetical protein
MREPAFGRSRGTVPTGFDVFAGLWGNSNNNPVIKLKGLASALLKRETNNENNNKI